MGIHPQSHLILVAGGKGGMGKSVFAANLALAFLNELRAPTLLLDLDQNSCGDQNIITGLRPNKTISEFLTFTGSLSPNALNEWMSKHPSGLAYLAAVRTPDERLDVEGSSLAKQIESLSHHFRFIIADVGHEIGPAQMALIDLCTLILVVTVPELLAINQTRRMMNDLQASTVHGELFHIVINRANNQGLSPQAISQALRRPVIAVIPQDDATVGSSIQKTQPFVFTNPKAPISSAFHDLVRRLGSGTLQQLKALSRPKVQIPSVENTPHSGAISPSSQELDGRNLFKTRIHNELIEAMDLKKGITDTKGDPSKERQLEQKTRQVITQIVDRHGQGLPREERGRIIKEVFDEALSLGPLEDLLNDGNVTEIMVNGHKKIFVEKSGKVILSPVTFTSNLQLRNVIERIVTPLGRRIDEKTPYVDARLIDGSRVNAIIEPLAIDGPSLTIRKFPKDRMTAERYLEFGTLTKSMMDFLRICVEQRLNIVVSGGTGSGKTTLLNVLSSYIQSNQRIITVEDAAELRLNQEHVVRLETRPANMEGEGAVTIRDLIRNSLRMRPDRIIVGECRDGAALDMLQAMNTGHEGSMTTVHANNPREAVARLETLCLMSGMNLPVRVIREQIASAVDLIVQISRLSDGSRKVKSITEVVGMQEETITLQEIFRFKETGFDKNRKVIGQFRAEGAIPTFLETFEQKGINIPRNLFTGAASTTEAPPEVPDTRTGRTPLVRRNITPIKKTGGDS